MKILSEQLRNGKKHMFGREVSYIELTVEIDFGDGKPWFNTSTGFFDLNCAQFLCAVENPGSILPTLRASTRKCALQEVARRLFASWHLARDSVEILGNELDEKTT